MKPNKLLYGVECVGGIRNRMKSMDTAPKDRWILVWHDHDADPYHEPEPSTRLTIYGAWCEGNGYSPNGLYIAKFGGGYDEGGWEEPSYYMPDWWFKHDDEDSEMPLNPVAWMDLP